MSKLGQLVGDAAAAIERPCFTTVAERQIAELCASAWERIPEMTRRLSAAGHGPGNWPSWAALAAVPLLRKSSLAGQQAAEPPLGGLAPAPHPHGRVLYMSPGGILEPHLSTAESRLADLLKAAGVRADDIVLNGFNYHFTPAGLLFHGALQRLGATCLPGGPMNSELLIQYMQRTRATGFVGIGSHLKLLIEHAESDGLKVGTDLPLRIALVGAEPNAEALRGELRERYGIHCFDLYGTADVGLVAGDCSAGEGLHVHPDVIVEVIDPVSGQRLPDGQVGELVMSVNNPEYPMLRYATGDLCSVLPEPCRCGNPQPRISRILGRADHSARVRGMLLYEHDIREVLARFPAVEQGRIDLRREQDRDEVSAVLKVGPAWNTAQQEAFEHAFRAKCRLRLDSLTLTDDAVAFQGRVLCDHRSSIKVGQT